MKVTSISVGLVSLWLVVACVSSPTATTLSDDVANHDADRVNVTFYIMSKCPDTSSCESELQDALDDLAPLINVKIVTIGTTLPTGQVLCKHGWQECYGNKLQLCAQNMTHDLPPPDGLKFFHFAHCMTSDRSNIPGNAEHCADRLGLDMEALVNCANGTQGEQLLKHSVAYAQGHGVAHSCTIHINDVKFCVHDGSWHEIQCMMSHGVRQAPINLKRAVCASSEHSREHWRICGQSESEPTAEVDQ